MLRAWRGIGAVIAGVIVAALVAAGCGSDDPVPTPTATTSSGGAGQGGAGQGGAGQGGTDEGGGGAGQGGGGAACTPGQVVLCYSGPPETIGVGICTWGEATCNEAGTGYGPCEGEVLPQDEVPGDPIDDDCDGTTVSVGESLVARYYINEDPAATQIEDSSGSPLPLLLANPDPQMPQMVLTEDLEGHRGLSWAAAGGTAVAAASINGTKIISRLNGNQAFTIELVARVDSIVNFTRVVFIGRSEPGQNPDDALVLRFDNAGMLQAYIENTSVGRWPFDYAMAGRAVIHLVVDSTQPIPDVRRRLYVNGTLVPAADAAAPAQLSNVNLSMATVFSLGNRPAGTHSFGGTLYYAALYDAALSASDVEANAAQLLVDDDMPL